MLIENYHKQVTVNKIKKFYTNMNQALMQAQVDNGEYSTWSYETSEDFYNKYIKPYIKNVYSESSVHMHGDFTGGIRFVFADGTQAIFAKNSYFLNSDNSNRTTPVFIFYTNAQKHINSNSNYLRNPTRERFYFVINKNGIIQPPHSDMTREYNKNLCKQQKIVDNEQTKNGNLDCSTVIYKDGWKIAPDYPW